MAYKLLNIDDASRSCGFILRDIEEEHYYKILTHGITLDIKAIPNV